MLYDHKTIFAPATHPGKAGVSIIRISGNQAKNVIEKISTKTKIVPRVATFTPIINPFNNELIDHAIILWFPQPHSFTGEDIVELHIHGCIAIINSLMEILASFEGFRVALPGEFAKRAFLNGKMDLTQAEGLADLIDAETSLQHKQALRQMSGQLEKLYDTWRSKIITILANVEAYIDFPEEDIPANIVASMYSEIENLKEAIRKHLQDNRGEKLRSGLYTTIIGKPNVGKSSLLNFLAKRDVAIVSNIAGTTRDIIEVSLDLSGIPITIADTAGIRESSDTIESEGIKRTLERSQMADFNIIMFDSNDLNIDSNARHIITKNDLHVINKVDLKNLADHEFANISDPILISLKTGEGIERFLDALTKKAQSLISSSSEPVITRTRYRNHLQHCLNNLEEFSLEKYLELAAEDLRLAASELGQITGAIDVDTILDEIFRNFCIGK